jgi:hypothetical protein
VHRDQAGLAELGASDREHTGPQIDVLQLEITRFADPQPSDAEEAEQTIVGPPAQLAVARQCERRLKQAADLLVRVEIRSRSLRAIGQ